MARSSSAWRRAPAPDQMPTDSSVTSGALPPILASKASCTLSELAQSARGGDPASAESLLAKVHQIAVRYARARLGSFGAVDLAQDVAQEVCVAVLTALPTYADRGAPFEAFVYAVASNKVRDVQRGLLRGPEPVDELPERIDPAACPEEQAMLGDAVTRVVAAMSHLPEQQGEIIVLRVGVGMSSDETAAARGMTPGAVRVAQHRALATLRRLTATTPLSRGGVA